MGRPGPYDGVIMEIIEFTDPGCVWSWAAHPVLARFREHLPGVRWRRVFGVQLDGPYGGRADADAALAGWREVARTTGVPLTDSLAYAHVSTRAAATAAAAAELQGAEVADAALLRLRESFFLRGRPADTTEAVAEALDGLPGLDLARLLRDMESPAVKDRLDADWAETRDPLPEALAGGDGVVRRDGDRVRYAFPTIVVRGARGVAVLAAWHPLEDYLAAAARVGP